MSILASLARAYDRLPDAPPFGYSMEKIGLIVGLNLDGTVASVTPWMDGEGKRRKARRMIVPQPAKRTSGIEANFLWDKTAYTLGIIAGEGDRTAKEHAAFKQLHENVLASADDAGLRALLLFLRQWTPEQFVSPTWADDYRGHNVVFVLESERRQGLWLHDRPAAKALWTQISASDVGRDQICLVTGEARPVARLHPAIKGVWDGQSSGGSIVAFNKTNDAFESYGHKQGDNAPVSEVAAAKYTTVLNRYLDRDNGHCIQIGDASTVFWADTSNLDVAAVAEGSFFAMFAGREDKEAEQAESDEAQSKRIGILLERLRKGEQLEKVDPDLAEGVRFHVLGLAPNAARISIRFYYEDDFRELARNYQRFVADMRIEPPPREPYPPLWRYLVETAVLGKRENVPPNLAGEWMRAILSGNRYPLTLLSTVLSRIRADGEINALRVGIIRALLVRNYRMAPGNGDKRREAPVALDTENRNKGYLLGRLFALYEHIQTSALGRNVNATIKDKFYGAASATPRNVFPLLERGSANHLSKIGKQRPGQRVNLEKALGEIMGTMAPGDEPFPASLGLEDQGMFGLGYHHQRGELFRKRDAGTEEAA